MNKEKPKVGEIINGNLLIARVHEWEKYYDLEVINKDTDESGHKRIFK